MNSGLECPSWKQNSIWPGVKLHGSLIQLPGTHPRSIHDPRMTFLCPSTYDSSTSRFETIHVTLYSIAIHQYLKTFVSNTYVDISNPFKHNQYISSITAYDQPTDNPIDIDVCPSELFHHWIGSVQANILTGNHGLYHQIYVGFSEVKSNESIHNWFVDSPKYASNWWYPFFPSYHSPWSINPNYIVYT